MRLAISAEYCKPAYYVLFSGWLVDLGSSVHIQQLTLTPSLTIFMGNQFKWLKCF